MGSFKIEKNIPIPPRRDCAASVIDKMEIGDSVLCKNQTEATAIRMTATRHNRRISQRKVKGGIRVWRTK